MEAQHRQVKAADRWHRTSRLGGSGARRGRRASATPASCPAITRSMAAVVSDGSSGGGGARSNCSVRSGEFELGRSPAALTAGVASLLAQWGGAHR